MIIDNTYMPAYQTINRIGSDFYVFCFDGAVPATIEDIPFEMFLSTEFTSVNSNIDDLYKIFHWENLYNSCIHHSLITANYAEDSSGNTLRPTVAFSQKNSSVVAYPKLSYYDYTVSKYRHIPKAVSTDLNKYAIACSNPPINNTYGHYYNLLVPGWNTQNNYGTYWAIPDEDRQRAEGFYMEFDFEAEVGIDYVNITTLGSNMFEGDLRILRWDETLNNGDGDWVLAHTESPIPQQDSNTINFSSQIVTTKLRFEFDEADGNANYTAMLEIEFLGATPIEENVPKDITWAIVIPQNPALAAWMEYSHEGAFILATAGGPGDTADLIFNRTTPIAGRNCPLLESNYKFLPYEV